MHHSFVSWEIILLYFFAETFIWLDKKIPSKWKISDFRLFSYFDRFLLLKVYKISAKNVLKIYISWNWRLMQSSKKNWFVVSRWILTWALEILKISNLIDSFCAKYITFHLKKSRTYLLWHWIMMQNLKKNWLVVWKMTWEIWQIFAGALEKSQSWDCDEALLFKVKNVGA